MEIKLDLHLLNGTLSYLPMNIKNGKMKYEIWKWKIGNSKYFKMEIGNWKWKN